MSAPKKQHWVPKFYLRYFAIPKKDGTPSDQVWAFSRNKNDRPEFLRINIEDAASKKFLYSARGNKGARDFGMEEKLADLEQLLSRIWPRLARGFVPLSDSVRKALSLFLGTMYLRHPSQRQVQRDHHRQLVAFYQSAFDGLGEVPNKIELVLGGKRRTLRTAGWEQWSNSTEEDLHRSFVKVIQSESIVIAKPLLKRRWSMIFSELPVFITSDNPLILKGPPGREGRFGFGTPGLTIYFPISPYRVLRIDDRSGDGLYHPLVKARELDIKPWSVLNYLTWVNAWRFMFGPRPCSEVLEEIVAFEKLARGIGTGTASHA